jgi:hypothetical protein
MMTLRYKLCDGLKSYGLDFSHSDGKSCSENGGGGPPYPPLPRTFNKRENGRLASDVELWINAATDVHRLPE